jgi:anti-anti-sigma factor
MEINTRRVKDVVVADLIGRLDSQTCGPASTELNRIVLAGDRKVLVNLAGIEYLSSAGLRALHVAAKLLKSHHGALKICQAQPMVKEVLDVTGIGHLLDHHTTEAEALEAFV